MTTVPRLSDAQVADFKCSLDTVGYAACESFLSPDQCDELRLRLEAAVAQYVPRGSERGVLDQYLLHDLLCRDISFARLLEDPRLQQIIEPVLGPYWIMYAFTSSSLPPGGTNYGHRVHVDSPRFVAGYPFNVGLIWALDDFDDESGGTEVLPGSHHSGSELPAGYFNRHCVRITCPRGSLFVFNARLYHRSGENRGARFRHALTMNVCRPFMKQRMDWVRFIPRQISDQLNAQARRIIGFDTRLPTSLDEFFVSDDKLLYKPGQG